MLQSAIEIYILYYRQKKAMSSAQSKSLFFFKGRSKGNAVMLACVKKKFQPCWFMSDHWHAGSTGLPFEVPILLKWVEHQVFNVIHAANEPFQWEHGSYWTFDDPTNLYFFGHNQLPFIYLFSPWLVIKYQNEPRFYFQHEAFKVNCHDVSRQTRKVTALRLSFTTCIR